MDFFYALGLMSGTSCDGLDVVLTHFDFSDNTPKFEVIKSKTYNYDQQTRKMLLSLHLLSAEELRRADINFARLSAAAVNDFTKDINVEIDFIASHGHTVFHNPSENYTFQIGDGNTIAKLTGIKTVFDFRSGDIALGGQGAPLVPIGDELLFCNYDACLNIGGFANISKLSGEKRIAYDIAPANIVINNYARKEGKEYDNNGELAQQGKIIASLLEALSNLNYYSQKPPKSLGREWVEQTFIPIVETYPSYSNTDILRTLTEHIAQKIANELNDCKNALITGGGAYNSFLIQAIKRYCKTNLVIPNDIIINYKEAIIFALLGALRLNEKDNCLANITGAKRNSCCGLVALP